MRPQFLLVAALSLAISVEAQPCSQSVCENTALGIKVEVDNPNSDPLQYDWNIPVAFTGQSTDSIAITNIGAAPATVVYTIEVLNVTTGCVSTYQCQIEVLDAASYAFTIPPVCSTDPPFDITPYISPSGANISGPGISGSTFDPSVGGSVTASPPSGSGCITANTTTPTIYNPPSILGVTITQ